MKQRSEARVGAGQVEVYVDPEERSRQGHGCACSRLRQESPGGLEDPPGKSILAGAP